MPFEKLISFTKDISDLPDKPNTQMSASQLKAHFDAAPDEVRQYLNKVIDVLMSTTADSGARNIGLEAIVGLEGVDVQVAIEWLKANKTEISGNHAGTWQGFIPEDFDSGYQAIDLASHKADYTTHVNDISAHGDTLSIYRSGKDANAIFTTIEYKRPDTSLAKKSVLSGGTSPKYTTRTVTYYGVNGTTVLSTKTLTLTYTGDDLTSEVLV